VGGIDAKYCGARLSGGNLSAASIPGFLYGDRRVLVDLQTSLCWSSNIEWKVTVVSSSIGIN
jgi:hypothetical protein